MKRQLLNSLTLLVSCFFTLKHKTMEQELKLGNRIGVTILVILTIILIVLR